MSWLPGFKLIRAPSRGMSDDTTYPVGRPGSGRGSPRKRHGSIWLADPWPSCQSTSVSLLTRWLSPCVGLGSHCEVDEDGPVSWQDHRAPACT